MKRLLTVVLSTQLLLLSGSAFAGKNADWALKGGWTDSCSCKVACQCLLGSGPTEKFCEGATLVEIEAGHYDGVKLDNIKAIVTYRGGKWTKIYVSEEASKKQVKAVTKLVPQAIPFLSKGKMLKAERTKVTVKRTEDEVHYAAAETTVELEVVKGTNGKPITTENLPAAGLPFPHATGHTQYKAKKLDHKHGDTEFSWKGRNGFTAKLDVSSTESGK